MEVKTKNDELVEKIINILGEPNENEFAMEIEKAKQLKNKAKGLSSILAKYEKKLWIKRCAKICLKILFQFYLEKEKISIYLWIFI